ncbi:MAG: bacillithiol biosynthesis cysteine-adding enzyme BshC [Candidatus Acidiferrales bacterium]
MTSSMEPHCLPFRELPHTTELFAAFTDDFKRVQRYYGHPPTEAGILAAAREVHLDPEIRRSVVEVLREQNAVLAPDSKLPAETATNLDRLASGAVAIVTGQQVGLFSGPAYSIYKAVTALRWAEAITQRGVDAVPIFWLATEDHDLAEVNHSDWNTREGLARFDLPAREDDAGRRVGEVLLGDAVNALAAKAGAALEGPFAEEFAAALRESYAPGESYGSAFGKLMARIFKSRGLIFIDPLNSRLHHLSAPVYRRALDEAGALRDALLARSKELENSGFHAQVKVTRESTLLFYNVAGRRQPVRSRNGNFTAGKSSFTRDDLRAAIDKSPELFSANVLLRPVIQDTLLPTAAYIGGPAEIAYMAQGEVVYKALLGRMPAIVARAGFSVIEPLIARVLAKIGLDVRDVFRGRQFLRKAMERKFLPRSLAARFDADEKAFRRLLAKYRKPLAFLDSTLVGSLDSAEQKMLHQFLKLKEKAGRAENLRTGVLDHKESLILSALYPHKDLQERTLCALPWLAAYGPEFLDTLARNIDLAAPQHHVLFL